MKRGIEDVEDVEEQELKKDSNVLAIMKEIKSLLGDYRLLEMIYNDFIKQNYEKASKVIINPILDNKIKNYMEILSLEGVEVSHVYEYLITNDREGMEKSITLKKILNL